MMERPDGQMPSGWMPRYNRLVALLDQYVKDDVLQTQVTRWVLYGLWTWAHAEAGTRIDAHKHEAWKNVDAFLDAAETDGTKDYLN